MKLIETLKSIDRKTYIYIGVAIVVIVAAILIIRRIRRKSEAEKGVEEIKETITQTNLTYETVQYSTFADRLESYLSDKSIFTGGLHGVNQKGVYEVFGNMKTDDDVKQLIVAFGTRKFRQQLQWSGAELTLPQALPYLMTTGEIKEINEILKENKINYQF